MRNVEDRLKKLCHNCRHSHYCRMASAGFAYDSETCPYAENMSQKRENPAKVITSKNDLKALIEVIVSDCQLTKEDIIETLENTLLKLKTKIMTQEDKALLLTDLCARLTYGIKVATPKGDGFLCTINQTIFGTEYGINISTVQRDYFNDKEVEIKPYLRPMLSMTKEEFNEYETANEIDTAESSKAIRKNLNGENYISSWYHGVDWLNAHHFDYRGLITKGLALEAPEGMYDKNS